MHQKNNRGWRLITAYSLFELFLQWKALPKHGGRYEELRFSTNTFGTTIKNAFANYISRNNTRSRYFDFEGLRQKFKDENPFDDIESGVCQIDLAE
jgi:hypothetical protein